MARGAVPSARVAVYKACGLYGWEASDVMAALDDKIADGVDIVTISIGPNDPTRFDFDSIAIGAFHAVERGIFTSQSMGSGGPMKGFGGQPCTMDSHRSSIFMDKVVLDNGKALTLHHFLCWKMCMIVDSYLIETDWGFC